jgi:hypothetical protein
LVLVLFLSSISGRFRQAGAAHCWLFSYTTAVCALRPAQRDRQQSRWSEQKNPLGRELPSLRNEERFSTWLYRIAYNGSMQQLERRKRDQARHSAMQQETKKP